MVWHSSSNSSQLSKEKQGWPGLYMQLLSGFQKITIAVNNSQECWSSINLYCCFLCFLYSKGNMDTKKTINIFMWINYKIPGKKGWSVFNSSQTTGQTLTASISMCLIFCLFVLLLWDVELCLSCVRERENVVYFLYISEMPADFISSTICSV